MKIYPYVTVYQEGSDLERTFKKTFILFGIKWTQIGKVLNFSVIVCNVRIGFCRFAS